MRNRCYTNIWTLEEKLLEQLSTEIPQVKNKGQRRFELAIRRQLAGQTPSEAGYKRNGIWG